MESDEQTRKRAEEEALQRKPRREMERRRSAEHLMPLGMQANVIQSRDSVRGQATEQKTGHAVQNDTGSLAARERDVSNDGVGQRLHIASHSSAQKGALVTTPARGWERGAGSSTAKRATATPDGMAAMTGGEKRKPWKGSPLRFLERVKTKRYSAAASLYRGSFASS